jgi:hypothetical protein
MNKLNDQRRRKTIALHACMHRNEIDPKGPCHIYIYIVVYIMIHDISSFGQPRICLQWRQHSIACLFLDHLNHRFHHAAVSMIVIPCTDVCMHVHQNTGCGSMKAKENVDFDASMQFHFCLHIQVRLSTTKPQHLLLMTQRASLPALPPSPTCSSHKLGSEIQFKQRNIV